MTWHPADIRYWGIPVTFACSRNLSFCLALVEQNWTKSTLTKHNGLQLPDDTQRNFRTLTPTTVRFSGSNITGFQTVTNLGVTFHHNCPSLTRRDRRDARHTAVLSRLGQCRHALPSSTMATVLQALVVSLMRYCVSVYCVCGATQRVRCDAACAVRTT